MKKSYKTVTQVGVSGFRGKESPTWATTNFAVEITLPKVAKSVGPGAGGQQEYCSIQLGPAHLTLPIRASFLGESMKLTVPRCLAVSSNGLGEPRDNGLENPQRQEG